jgi:hypothetical protein
MARAWVTKHLQDTGLAVDDVMTDSTVAATLRAAETMRDVELKLPAAIEHLYT